MMDLKRILIISLVLFILSLTAVSASDLNGTQVTNSSHTDEFLAINENVNTEHLINDTSPGTFEELEVEIITTQGPTLYLTRDYIG